MAHCGCDWLSIRCGVPNYQRRPAAWITTILVIGRVLDGRTRLHAVMVERVLRDEVGHIANEPKRHDDRTDSEEADDDSTRSLGVVKLTDAQALGCPTRA